MKITTISIGKTISEGDFEFTRIDLTADIEEGEIELDAADELFRKIKKIYKSQR